uniref:Uncharacterized protein n=1 Tax=Zea mays TaxID=4577 RepID=A0A804Q8B5_MAIZE
MFPVTDAEAPPTANPRGFANLLWKQLDHLGGREDGAEQSADNAVAGVQEEAEQARVPHAVVGSAARRLCQPVPVHLRLEEFRLQEYQGIEEDSQKVEGSKGVEQARRTGWRWRTGEMEKREGGRGLGARMETTAVVFPNAHGPGWFLRLRSK